MSRASRSARRGADSGEAPERRPRLVDSDPAGATDHELLQRIRQADERGLDLLIERYWSALHSFLDHILDDPDLADDLAQETFVRLWARRESWGLEGSLRGLLYQIGRRLAFDAGKRRRRRMAWLDRLRLQPGVATPEDHLDGSELDAAVRQAVADLPERRRIAFLMARWEGRSHREIATAMGISVQTVSNQLTSALAELRTRLGPFLDGR
ncbi:MAG: RNA polymerase sigma factor [Gemmatimonadales bacterium]